MIISKCPRCHEDCRVPTGPLPVDLHAQCPWCHENFPISEVTGPLPPELKLVTAEGEPFLLGTGGSSADSSGPTGANFQIDTGIDDVMKRGSFINGADHDPLQVDPVHDNWAQQRGNDLERLQSRKVLDFHDTSFETYEKLEKTAIDSMKVTSNGNSRRQNTSGLRTLLGIALGGIASVPIAGCLLMLMGRTPDWGFWPFYGERGPSSVKAAPLPTNSDGSATSRPAGKRLRFNVENPGRSLLADPAESAVRDILQSSDADDSQDTGADASNKIDAEQKPNDLDLKASRKAAATELATRASQMLRAMTNFNGTDEERQRRIGLTYETLASVNLFSLSSDDQLANLAKKVVDSPLLEDLRLEGWKQLVVAAEESSGVALIGVTVVSDDGIFLTNDAGEMVKLELSETPGDSRKVLIMGRLKDQRSTLTVLHMQPIP